jgi:hypothetical protein
VRAVYERGRVNIKEAARLAAWKSKLTDGTEVAVTFEQWQESRTRRQQALLHSLIGRYARKVQEPFDIAKIRFKLHLGHFVPWVALKEGRAEFPRWRGEWINRHIVDPFFYPDDESAWAFVRSEKTYTKRMEAEFVETVIAACQENEAPIDDILEGLRQIEDAQNTKEADDD